MSAHSSIYFVSYGKEIISMAIIQSERSQGEWHGIARSPK